MQASSEIVYDTVEKYLKKINVLLNMGAAFNSSEEWVRVLGTVMVLNKPI